MDKERRLPERRQQILEATQGAGQLSVAELSTQFDVSNILKCVSLSEAMARHTAPLPHEKASAYPDDTGRVCS